MFQSLFQDKIIQYEATPCSGLGNTDVLTDGALWTIISTDKVTHDNHDHH